MENYPKTIPFSPSYLEHWDMFLSSSQSIRGSVSINKMLKFYLTVFLYNGQGAVRQIILYGYRSCS